MAKAKDVFEHYLRFTQVIRALEDCEVCENTKKQSPGRDPSEKSLDTEPAAEDGEAVVAPNGGQVHSLSGTLRPVGRMREPSTRVSMFLEQETADFLATAISGLLDGVNDPFGLVCTREPNVPVERWYEVLLAVQQWKIAGYSQNKAFEKVADESDFPLSSESVKRIWYDGDLKGCHALLEVFYPLP